MIRNRHNYPTPPIRDIKGKETQSQTDSCLATKWPNTYPKQKGVIDTHIQRQSITKINHGRRTALEWSVKSILLGWGSGSGGGGGGGGEVRA